MYRTMQGLKLVNDTAYINTVIPVGLLSVLCTSQLEKG